MERSEVSVTLEGMRKPILISLCLILLTVGTTVGALMWSKRAPQGSEAAEKGNTLYVSLGDSVASGLGLATPADTSGCGRTREAYPYILAAKEELQLVHLACTGATLEAGINNPQMAAAEQASQREALFEREPGLITLGIGANDVIWLSLLAQCFELSCGSSEDRARYEQLLKAFRDQLRTTLVAIDERYNGGTRLLVIGYYQVFPPASMDCQDTARLNGEELNWGRELRSQLNEAVSDVVKETGVGTYVEIDFSGHELCTGTPWVQGVTDPAPYHANAAGQMAIAEQIEKALKTE